MANRIDGTVTRPAAVSFTLDGRTLTGIPGEALAAALLASGIRHIRVSPRRSAPRGIFCMMGSCQECLVHVDGRPALACAEPVREGMVVVSGGGL